MYRLTTAAKSLGAASLLLAVATACSSPSAIPPAPSASAMQPSDPNAGLIKKKKAKALLYVAVQYLDEIYVYEQTKKKSPVFKYIITNGLDEPDGITTDESGNLYVANQHSVTIYKPGASSPATTITSGVDYASDVAVDSAGDLYVTNNGSGSLGQWIDYYPAGSTTPAKTWLVNSSRIITGIALIYPNQSGPNEFYISFFTTTQGSYVAVGDVGFCTPTYATCFDDSYAFGKSGGIAMASSGYSKAFDFVTVDQNIPGYENLDAYGVTPVKTGGIPSYLAFNSDGTQLYVSNQLTQTVDEFAYPSMRAITSYKLPGSEGSYHFNIPTGVAVSPAGTYL